jgi:hypothetical protein
MPDRVDDQQTLVIGQTRLAPGSNASLRVVVQDFAAGEPIAGAHVKVLLKPSTGRALPLFEGHTDETGSLPVSFHVPLDAPAQADLIVESESSVGRDRVEQPVTVEHDYRLLLATDKPLYQPGQIVHMRALALSTLDLSPARGATIQFLVEDPKGNKVFRHSGVASDFGVAATDFQLADLVIHGDYKLSIAIGDTRSEKTVEVRPYVLPKFAIELSTDRSFYLPGQRVEGAVSADYFFGKPVAGSQLEIAGSVWDVERTVVVDLRGQTDAEGRYAFAFDLPDYFAGSGLDAGQAHFALEVTVIDQTGHAEQTSSVLPIAAQPLIIEAVPESGVLKPGVENIIYVLAAYPDARPARADLSIQVDGAAAANLTTGEYGLAEFAFTPQPGVDHTLEILARDEAGLEAHVERTFPAEGWSGDAVLLRPDRATYLVGETLQLAAFTPVQSGDIYLDIVRAGQTLSTRSTRVQQGRAEFTVDASPDLYGTLELHAYKVLPDGTLVRDTRVVVVDAPTDVAIDIAADQDTYLPGDKAVVDLRTTDVAGNAGLETALGIAIVDESVFALERQDPGFAKLYFILEQQLLEPFYQVKGFELPASLPPDEAEMRAAQDEAARAAWAGLGGVVVPAATNSREEKLDATHAAQQRGYDAIGLATVVALIVVPFSLWAVVGIVVRRSGEAKRALVRLAILSAVIVSIGACLAGWLLVGQQALYWLDPEILFLPAGLLLGLFLLAFVIYAWAGRDPEAKFLALLTLAWCALVALLIVTGDAGGEPGEVWVLAAALAFLLLPGAFLLFGQARWLQKRRAGGVLATGLGTLAAIPAMVILPAALLFSGGGAIGAMAPVQRMEGLDAGWAPAAVEEEVMVEVAREVEMDRSGESTGAETPRLRQFFPETLYWAPEVVTDEAGFVSLEIPMADSITTWRLTALASSQDGRLGFTTRGLRVFQDFFVDIDLPVALTQGDEISVPVGVFNYLPEAQEVRLVIEPEPWFELSGAAERTITIASNEVDVVYFPIRVRDFGRQGFQVTAWGEQMSDAIRRQVTIVPDGKEIRLSESNWLRGSEEVALTLPADAIPETPSVEVKIYPGVMAQAVEGLEKILRLPHG